MKMKVATISQHHLSNTQHHRSKIQLWLTVDEKEGHHSTNINTTTGNSATGNSATGNSATGNTATEIQQQELNNRNSTTGTAPS